MKKTKTLSKDTISDIQLLFAYRVKASAIAMHFGVSAPTISYHTKPIEQKSVLTILTKLKKL